MKNNDASRQLSLAALLMAVGFVLPFVTGHVPAVGNMLCPMHIPVMLCGFLCGAPLGALLGAVLPILRGLVLGMPPLIPTGCSMAFELAAYGFLCGFLSRRDGRDSLFRLYVILIVSMLLGRCVWGVASYFILRSMGNAFTWHVFFVRGFMNATVGILLQLVIIPPLVLRLRRVEK